MTSVRPIVPCLWFNDQAEEAARLYTGVFPNSRITRVLHYNGAGEEIHGQPAGKVMTVSFELDGQPFTALNGGPMFKLNEAVSFQVLCETQEELDHYWDKLCEGGDPGGAAMRLAQGPVRRVVAGDAAHPHRHARRPRPGPVAPDDEEVLTMRKFDIAALERVHAR